MVCSSVNLYLCWCFKSSISQKLTLKRHKYNVILSFLFKNWHKPTHFLGWDIQWNNASQCFKCNPVQPGLFLAHLGRNPRKLPLRALLLVLLFVFLGALTAIQVAVQRRVLCWTAGWHWNKNLTWAEVAAFLAGKATAPECFQIPTRCGHPEGWFVLQLPIQQGSCD